MNVVQGTIEICREAAQPFIDHFFLKSTLALIGISTGFLFGVEFYNHIWIVIVLVAVDAGTGVWGARESGQVISSKRFLTTVPKLLRYLIFIAVGHLLQSTIPFNLYIENIIIVFLATTEFISIVENLGKSGMPIPKKLLKKIEEVRDNQ